VGRARVALSRGTVKRHSEAVGLLTGPGEYAFVKRGVLRSIVMRCPDDCGEIVTINLDRRSGPAWRIYQRNGHLTVYPSVWRSTGCRSHFIISQDNVFWCDSGDAYEESTKELMAQIFAILPAHNALPRHYEDIASEMEAIPWEVLWACNSLERMGRAVSSDKGTMFRRASSRVPKRRTLDIFG